MKELLDLHEQDKTEIHARKQEGRQKQYIRSLRLQRGQKVWELDMATQQIKEAEYEKAAVNFALAADGTPSVMHHQLIVRENCLYEVALNANNARRKFLARLYKHYKSSKHGQ
jgi:hypothetical protein